MNHEVLNDAMKLGALVTETLGTGGQLGEVLGRLWHCLAEQANFNGASSLTANGHVKEDLKNFKLT